MPNIVARNHCDHRKNVTVAETFAWNMKGKDAVIRLECHAVVSV